MPKLKDKKLVDEVHTTLTHFLYCVDLQQVLEALLTGLKDKLPMIQRQTLICIERALHQTYLTTVKSIQSEVQPLLVALTDSFDTETKEQSCKTLGVLCQRLGTVDKLDLPQPKKSKVEEAALTVKPSKYDH